MRPRRQRYHPIFFDPSHLHDPVHLERPLIPAQMAVRNQNQLLTRPADPQRIDHPLGPLFSTIEINHQHRAMLFQRFIQLERKRVFLPRCGQKPHRSALLAQAIAQTDGPPADRMHQMLENKMRRLRVGQRAVRSHLRHTQPHRQPTEPIASATESPAGDSHRVQHMNTGAKHC